MTGPGRLSTSSTSATDFSRPTSNGATAPGNSTAFRIGRTGSSSPNWTSSSERGGIGGGWFFFSDMGSPWCGCRQPGSQWSVGGTTYHLQTVDRFSQAKHADSGSPLRCVKGARAPYQWTAAHRAASLATTARGLPPSLSPPSSPGPPPSAAVASPASTPGSGLGPSVEASGLPVEPASSVDASGVAAVPASGRQPCKITSDCPTACVGYRSWL